MCDILWILKPMIACKVLTCTAFINDNLLLLLCLSFHIHEYRYAALQEGGLCFCSDAYGTHSVGNNTACDYPCTGNANYNCGGYYYNKVFSTPPVLIDFILDQLGKWQNKWYLPINETPSTGNLALTTRQAWADDRSKISQNYQKSSNSIHFMTIFGINFAQ